MKFLDIKRNEAFRHSADLQRGEPDIKKASEIK